MRPSVGAKPSQVSFSILSWLLFFLSPVVLRNSQICSSQLSMKRAELLNLAVCVEGEAGSVVARLPTPFSCFVYCVFITDAAGQDEAEQLDTESLWLFGHLPIRSEGEYGKYGFVHGGRFVKWKAMQLWWACICVANGTEHLWDRQPMLPCAQKQDQKCWPVLLVQPPHSIIHSSPAFCTNVSCSSKYFAIRAICDMKIHFTSTKIWA